MPDFKYHKTWPVDADRRLTGTSLHLHRYISHTLSPLIIHLSMLYDFSQATEPSAITHTVYSN